MVRFNHLIYLAAFSFVAETTPVPDRPSSHVNITHKNFVAPRSVWSAQSLDDAIKTHWQRQAGGLKNAPQQITEAKKIKFLDDLSGNKIPLISLDCENADTTEAYKGKYYGVCMNYLWWRNCDHTTKERSIKTNAPPGYVLLHRGEKGSNTVRRKLGGFKSHIPCSKSRANTNTFLLHGKESSQEEFPMALMEEGGRYTPSSGLIGATRVASGVDRSPVFRCIDAKENSSAGSKIGHQIESRKIRRTSEISSNQQTTNSPTSNSLPDFPDIKPNQKDPSPPSSPVPKRGTSTPGSPSGTNIGTGSQPSQGNDDNGHDGFYFDVYNYGPMVKAMKIDWHQWDSKCQNDGGQFVGLAEYIDEAEKKKTGGKKGKFIPNIPSTPKTPAGQSQSGQASTPNAPTKRFGPEAINEYFASIKSLVLKLKLKDQDNEDDDVDAPLPPGEASDKVAEMEGIQRWQWYPFSSNGIGEGKVVSLGKYLSDTDALVGKMGGLNLGSNEPTPSKLTKGGAASVGKSSSGPLIPDSVARPATPTKKPKY